MNDRCVTVMEASQYLSVSPRTLYTKNWRIRHGLRAQKIGRSVRFRLSELERFLQEQNEEDGVSATTSTAHGESRT